MKDNEKVLEEYAKRAKVADGDALIALTRQFLKDECGELGAALLAKGDMIPWIASFWVVYNHPADEIEKEEAKAGLLGFIGEKGEVK